MTTSGITISTHVLDTSIGAPAAGIAVHLEGVSNAVIATAETNADGRISAFPVTGDMEAGKYRLCFDVAPYFASMAVKSFYNEICIAFEVSEGPQHYHVPLLLSPYGYSTYRGS